jgi:hypothetical protein
VSTKRHRALTDSKDISFWSEYFGRYLNTENVAGGTGNQDYSQKLLSKDFLISIKRNQNTIMVDEIIQNLKAVNELRKGKNELVFS